MHLGLIPRKVMFTVYKALLDALVLGVLSLTPPTTMHPDTEPAMNPLLMVMDQIDPIEPPRYVPRTASMEAVYLF